MKINPKIESKITAAGKEISPVKTASLKADKPLRSKDRSVLSGEKEGKSRALPQIKRIKASTLAEARKKNWTVLCYFAGDNNLEEQMTINLIQMERLGVSKGINLLAQFDRGENPTFRLGGKPGMVRYKLQQFKLKPGDLDGFSRYNPATLPQIQDKHRRISSQELKELGPTDSADSRTLKSFLAWGMKEYPAKNYLVYVYGHGAGVDGFITDNGRESRHSEILPPEFKKTVQAAEKSAGVEKDQVILAFDSCQMAQAEVAYEFKDIAQKLLASESVQYGGGMLPEVLSRPEAAQYDPETMSRELFEQDRIPQFFDDSLFLMREPAPEDEIVFQNTISLIDLKQMPEVKKQIGAFIQAVKNSSAPREAIQRNLEIKSRPLYFTASPVCEYVSDLPDIARQISKDPEIKDPQLKKAASKLNAVLKQAIPGAYHREGLEFGKNSNGLGILATSNAGIYNRYNYHSLTFDRDTGWSEFMTSYAKEADPQAFARGLKEPVVKSPQLKRISKLAERELSRWEGLKKEIFAAEKDLRQIEDNPKFSYLEKSYYSQCRARQVSTLKAIEQLGAKAPKPQKEIVNAVLDALGSKFTPGNFKAALVILSALDGEISSKTLAGAARELEAGGESIFDQSEEKQKLIALGPDGLATRESGLEEKLHELTDWDNFELLQSQMGKETYRAWEKDFYAGRPSRAFGNKILTILAYASRNEKVVNLNNYLENNLSQLSRLAGGPEQSASSQAPAPEIKVKFPQLKEMAKIAQTGLDNFADMEPEIKAVGQEFYKFYTAPGSEKKDVRDIYRRAGKIGVIRQLSQINNQVASPAEKRLVGAILTSIIRNNPGSPEGLAAHLKAGLTVISALGGEVSSKTLAESARKLLEISPEYDDVHYAGEKYLHILGNLSGNPAIAWESNLEKIAKLDKPGSR